MPKRSSRRPRPRDANQPGKLIVGHSVGEAESLRRRFRTMPAQTLPPSPEIRWNKCIYRERGRHRIERMIGYPKINRAQSRGDT